MAVGYRYETLPTFPEVRGGMTNIERAHSSNTDIWGWVAKQYNMFMPSGNHDKRILKFEGDMEVKKEYYEGREVVPTGRIEVPEVGGLYKFKDGSISRSVCATGMYPTYEFVDEVDVDRRGFWMVIRGSGQGSGQTQKRHYSKSEAMREAERLARETRVGFFVLRADLYVEPETPPVRWRKVL